jgi:DNA-binding NarL/FixJ family response regulator
MNACAETPVRVGESASLAGPDGSAILFLRPAQRPWPNGQYSPAVSDRSPRVLIASADASLRTGLRVTLASAGFTVVAEVASADGATSSAATERPELALVSAELPGRAIDAVRELSPHARVVVLTRHRSGEELVDFVEAGASGYLGEDVSQARLPAILAGVLDGEVALPRRESQQLLDAIRGRDARHAAIAARATSALTSRELEVLDLLAAEAPTGEIARRLGISQVTVRRHVSAVLRKLVLTSRADVVRLLGERSGD